MNQFRIHPSIGFARVGTSEEYNLAPETPASLPLAGGDVTGGLPIRPGTEADHITSSDLRDDRGALKRQAARFHIYAYDGPETYPRSGGTPITIGTTVDGRTVTDIVWQVHVANKKANTYQLEYPPSGETSALANYQSGLPPLRNPDDGELDDPDRLKRFTIDPGPRTLRGSETGTAGFDAATGASFLNTDAGGADVVALAGYPTSFPSDNGPLYCPSGPIDTLGDALTDERGRLIVVGAYGRACATFRDDGSPSPLDDFVDNDGWFDDTADGPIHAVLVFDDGSTESAGDAWVVSTDPAYAPQTINVVSLWDDIFDTWVRKMDLMPSVYSVEYQRDFRPSFVDHVQPFFQAARVQESTTYLPDLATKAHDAVGKIEAGDVPGKTLLGGLGYIRNPNNPAEHDVGVPLMPLSLGDSSQPFLAPTLTQYFFLEQWDAGHSVDEASGMGPGEALDMASLFNCLGGRFSPGIDMTFIVRQPDVWEQDWTTHGTGPFRLRVKPLDYASIATNPAGTNKCVPLLTVGYVPVHRNDDGLEPGDTSKFMAIPWHTDYNSCATHTTQPNPANSTTLFWSWPAQRPVSVYVAADVVPGSGELPKQKYSVRGPGTSSTNPSLMGRYQDVLQMVEKWPDIGTVIQGNAIDEADGGPFNSAWLLEVASRLEQGSGEPEAEPWPLNATPGTQ